MNAIKDLTGQRFGALTVLSLADREQWPYGRTAWRCQCDCGKTCIVLGDFLRRGVRTSCGCRAGVAAKSLGRPKNVEHLDYTGKTFGELTGVKRLGPDRWLWRCSCGVEKSIRPSLVQTGEVLSCGHVLAETGRKKVVEDNVFGFADDTSLTSIASIMRGKIKRTNTSGANGVRVRTYPNGRIVYQARITFQRKEINLGTFSTLEEAKAARRAAEERYFGHILDKYKEESDE